MIPAPDLRIYHFQVVLLLGSRGGTTVGVILRDGMERISAFPSAAMLF